MEDLKYPLIRPANYPEKAKGRGYSVETLKDGRKILVINLMGRVFMKTHVDCPFVRADEILEKFKDEKLDAIFVDFHAETTSEKSALGHYLDGRITAFVGTHTHVPTCDERVLVGGTAYQSDVGFCGPIDSCIGVKKEIIIENFLTQMPVKHEVAEGNVVFNALLIQSEENGLKAKKVLRIQKVLNK